jgi:hypothetical protein
MVNKFYKLKRKTFSLVCVFIACISLLSCKYFKAMKEYRYDTFATCAPEYGIYLYTGIFKSIDGDIIPIYHDILNGPLGATGCPDVIGDGFNPIPNSLKVEFYSETEDKFYEGEFDLPYEQLEKMFQEESDDPFYKGQTFDDTQSGKTLKYMKYNVLSVGITIGGKVTVWVNGVNRNQVEIAHFQSKESQQVKWNDVFEYGTRQERVKDNSEIFSTKVKNEVLTKTLPFGLWDTYKENYNWRYKIELPSGGKADEIYMNMVNAEAECIYNTSPTLENDLHTKRAIPYNLEIRLHDAKGNKYLSWIVFTESDQYLKNMYKGGSAVHKYPEDFREEEIYKVFKSLDKTKPIDIIYRVNNTYEEIKIFAKQGEKEIPLTKVTAWFMSDN